MIVAMTPGEAAVMKGSANVFAAPAVERAKRSHSAVASARSVYATSATACGASLIRAAPVRMRAGKAADVGREDPALAAFHAASCRRDCTIAQGGALMRVLVASIALLTL